MIERDRLLFARLSRVNTAIGKSLGDMLGDFRCGLPPASSLRGLGRALRDVADDLLTRATELDGNVVDGQVVAPRPIAVSALQHAPELPAGTGGTPVRSSSPGSIVPTSHQGEAARQKGNTRCSQ